MGFLEEYMNRLDGIGGFSGLGISNHASQAAAMQQQQLFDYQALQAAMGAQQMPHNPAACIPMNYHPPPRKKVESKVIETVEIRPEQDVKLLKAGKGI